MLDRPDFIERLSSGDPVPGGGSVAALQVAMAAALLAMVSNLTLGRKKYADVQERVQKILAESLSLRDRAVQLVDDDVAAYTEVSTALSLPRGDDSERERRRVALQEALKGAALPPLDTMRVAASVLRLATELVNIGNRSAISDVGSAALAARAGYHAARLNVEINLSTVTDREWKSAMLLEVGEIPEPESFEQRVVAATEVVIRGESH